MEIRYFYLEKPDDSKFEVIMVMSAYVSVQPKN